MTNNCFKHYRIIGIVLCMFIACLGSFFPAKAQTFAQGIRLENEQTVYLKVGDPDYQLQYTLLPDDGTVYDDKVTFTVDFISFDSAYPIVVNSNNEIEDGIVVPQAPGQVRITATTHDGYSSEIYLNVGAEPTNLYFIDGDSKSSKVGDSTPTYFYCEPFGCDLNRREYSVDDDNVASVDSTGNVFGMSPGKATLTLKLGNMSASKEITVIPQGDYAEQISTDTPDEYLNVEESEPLQYTLYPHGNYNTTRGSTENEEITGIVEEFAKDTVSIDDNGVVTRLRNNSAPVKVRLLNGSEYEFTTQASALPTSIKPVRDTVYIKPDPNILYWAWRDWFVIAPEEASSCHLTITSSNPSIIEVDPDAENYIVAKQTGQCDITATADNGLNATVTVIVKNGHYADYIYSKGECQVGIGGSNWLSFDVGNYTDGDVSDDVIQYSIERGEDIISLTSDGKVTGLKSGNATVRATTALGHSATTTVHVYDEPTRIFFRDDEMTVVVGQNGSYAYINYVPGTASGYPVRMISSDSTVLRLEPSGSNFRAVGLKAGTVTITAETPNGLTAEMTVKVIEGDYASQIFPIDHSYRTTLDKDQTVTIGYQLSPTNPADEKVVWSTDPAETDVISVDQNGNVTALNYGSAYAVATIANGSSMRIKCTVPAPVNSLDTKKDFYKLPVGGYLQLSDELVVDAEYFDEDCYSVTCDNTEIAGANVYNVNGRKAGTTQVHITAGTITKTITVEVYDPVTPTTIDGGNTVTVYKGYLQKLSVIYEPETAARKTNWTSSNDTIAECKPAVDGEATITGNNIGTATVTATSASDPSLKTVFEINVVEGNREFQDDEVEYKLIDNQTGKVSANQPSYILYKNRTYQLDIHYRFKDQFPESLSKDTYGKFFNSDLIVPSGGGANGGNGFGDFGSTFGFRAVQTGEYIFEYLPGKTFKFIILDSAVTAPDVSAAESVTENVTNALETAGAMGTDTVLLNSLDIETVTESTGVNETVLEQLEVQGKKAVVQTYMDINATDMEKTDLSASLTVDITPKYKVVSLPKSADDSEMSTDRPLGEGNLTVTESVNMSIPVGDLFDGMEVDKVYVVHTKDSGEKYQYEATYDGTNVEFENPHGFSSFRISTTDSAVIRLDEQGYLSAEEALKNLEDGQTMTITDNIEDQTDLVIDKAVSFYVNKQTIKTVNIKAAPGYILTIEDGLYTVSDGNADSIAVSPKTLNLEEGKTGDLTATLTPAEALNEITWSSSDENVATVTNGTVTGVAEGTATITATTDNGLSDTATVTVTHVHTYDETKWENDENTHWHPCTKDDGAKGSEAEHTFGAPVVKTPPTCTAEGVQVETCSVCGNEKESPIPVAAHTLKEIPAVDPTHDAAGNIKYWQCEECNQLFKDSEGKETITAEETVLDQVPYDWSEEWTTSAEKHWHECNDGCGAKKDEVDHTFEWITDKEPTCKEPGSKHQECTVCHEKGATEAIPVIDHTFEWITDKEPTCEEDGSRHEECTVCKKTGQTEVLPATGHKFEWVTDKEPTCEEDGSRHEECTVCKKTGQTEVLSATGHDIVEVPGKEATHFADGVKTYYECKVCHKKFKDKDGKEALTDEEFNSDYVIPMIPHTYSEEWSHDANRHYHECTNKDGAIDEKTAEAHKWSAWKTVKEATVSAAGSQERVCEVCGRKETKEIAKLPDNKVPNTADSDNTGMYLSMMLIALVSACGAVFFQKRLQ